jgi:hypothetical protein
MNADIGVLLVMNGTGNGSRLVDAAADSRANHVAMSRSPGCPDGE